MNVEPYRDSVHIAATCEIVFDYFTRAEALTQWMGDRAIVDPRPGGLFTVFFEERAVEGRYLEVDRPRRLVISWGRVGSSTIPPDSSTLEVLFTPEQGGTRVDIVHSGLPTTSEAKRHAMGWRHYLGRMTTLASGGLVSSHETPEALTAGAD